MSTAGRLPILWLLAYATAVALTLVPSPLLEFRYFTIPYYIYRLSASHASTSDTEPKPQVTTGAKESLLPDAIELVALIIINAAVLYIFLYRPFEWSSEPGVKQRFMW